MVARDVRLTTRLGVSTGSELSPDAGFPIARDHGNGDQKLDDTDHTLQGLVPGRAAGRHHPGDLQCGGWKAQHAKEESDQDKPESPSPATKDPDHEDSDKRRERNQQRRLKREAFPIDLLQRLRVDPRARTKIATSAIQTSTKKATTSCCVRLRILENHNQNVRPSLVH